MAVDGLPAERGCESESNAVIFSWDLLLKRCPVMHFDESTWVAVSWWSDWRTFGFLPWPGDFGDQPAIVAEAMRVCVQVENEVSAGRERDATKGAPWLGTHR